METATGTELVHIGCTLEYRGLYDIYREAVRNPWGCILFVVCLLENESLKQSDLNKQGRFTTPRRVHLCALLARGGGSIHLVGWISGFARMRRVH